MFVVESIYNPSHRADYSLLKKLSDVVSYQVHGIHFILGAVYNGSVTHQESLYSYTCTKRK